MTSPQHEVLIANLKSARSPAAQSFDVREAHRNGLSWREISRALDVSWWRARALGRTARHRRH